MRILHLSIQVTERKKYFEALASFFPIFMGSAIDSVKSLHVHDFKKKKNTQRVKNWRFDISIISVLNAYIDIYLF